MRPRLGASGGRHGRNLRRRARPERRDGARGQGGSVRPVEGYLSHSGNDCGGRVFCRRAGPLRRIQSNGGEGGIRQVRAERRGGARRPGREPERGSKPGVGGNPGGGERDGCAHRGGNQDGRIGGGEQRPDPGTSDQRAARGLFRAAYARRGSRRHVRSGELPRDRGRQRVPDGRKRHHEPVLQRERRPHPHHDADFAGCRAGIPGAVERLFGRVREGLRRGCQHRDPQWNQQPSRDGLLVLPQPGLQRSGPLCHRRAQAG